MTNFGKQEDIQVASIMTATIMVDPLLSQPPYNNHWLSLAKGVAHLLFNMNKDPLALEESDLFEKESNQKTGLQTSFVKLVHSATSVSADPFISQITKLNRNQIVVEKLRPFISSNAQNLQGILQQLNQDKSGAKLCQALN